MAGQTGTARLQIVDGDQPLRLILAWGSENRGYRVWTAAGYRQAVAAAQAVASNVLLLEYRPPDGNGQALSVDPAGQQPRARNLLMSTDRAADAAEVDSGPVASTSMGRSVQLNRSNSFFKHGDVKAG